MSEYEGILESLEKLHGKVDRLLASRDNPILGDGIPADARFPAEPKKKLPLTIEKVIIKGGRTIPKTGKYQWFKVNNLPGVKVRKCSNEGCPFYLKYSEEKGKYEHWKYDPNTEEGGFVQDNCDFYLGGF